MKLFSKPLTDKFCKEMSSKICVMRTASGTDDVPNIIQLLITHTPSN
jgi:hypothetical protein